MRIRLNLVSISSVLFTVALVCLIPTFWANVITQRDMIWLAKLYAGYRLAAQTTSDLSVLCLVVILIGLIVIWTGYIKRARPAWLVMFVIVWAWAFPLMVLPLFKHTLTLSIPEWLNTAIHQPGVARVWAESVLIFLLMVIALLLPIKPFFVIGETQKWSHRPSGQFIGRFVASFVVVVIALAAWIHFSVYEIPLSELSSWKQFPQPPPPPPAPRKTE
jgi:hypothetical protein